MGQLLLCMEISTGLFPRLEGRKCALGTNQLTERIFAKFQDDIKNTPFYKKKLATKYHHFTQKEFRPVQGVS